MDAVLFLKEWKRMCDSFGDSCTCCKLHDLNICSVGEVINHPEKFVEIIEEWSSENPIKTLSDEFFEKFPNAPKDDRGCPPDVCPSDIGYIDLVDCVAYPHNPDCIRCWSRFVEDTTHKVN